MEKTAKFEDCSIEISEKLEDLYGNGLPSSHINFSDLKMLPFTEYTT